MADPTDKVPPGLSARDSELHTLAATIGPGAEDDAHLRTVAPPGGTAPPPDATGGAPDATVGPPDATQGPVDSARPGSAFSGHVTARGASHASTSEAVQPPALAEPAGQNPRYPLVKMIGEGGMGQIFLARQESLQREVAVKTIRPQFANNRLLDASFRSEALVTGDLEHPNIVPVHEMGRTPDGRAYMAMKLVKGFEWADLIHPGEHPERLARAATMQLRDHLDILVKICDAVAFAHSRNILHRDLKPRNVMVGEFGEVLVMDWGLALDISETPAAEPKALHRSAVKAAAGTPSYMPPELAIPEPARLGPATDVYLLGAVLYELLTGSPPHRGKSTGEILDAAKKGVIEAPELRAPGRRIPAELARIALHALAADPAARPQDALAFRQELRDFLSHEESVRLAEDADRQLSELQKPGAVAREHRYARYAEALSRIGEALHLWPENALALRSRGTAALSFADEALDRGDVGLAAAQVPVLDASPHLDQARTAAVRAALAAHASARTRQRFAVAMAAFLAFAFYATLGDRWHALVAEERAAAATDRFTKSVNAAWQSVRKDDLAALAVAEQALAAPELCALPEHTRARAELAHARAVLLWRRHRWEELLELATADPQRLPPDTSPALAALGEAVAAGRPAAAVRARLDQLDALCRKDQPRAASWYHLARAAVVGMAFRNDARGAPPLPFMLATATPVAEQTPLDLTFDPTRRTWTARKMGTERMGADGELWRYRPVRSGSVVQPGVPDDAGGLLLLSAGQVVRVDRVTGRVTARAVLREHPILAWPDPLDRKRLAVLVADDATTAGGRQAERYSGWNGGLDGELGGVFNGGGSDGLGCGRVRETHVVLEHAPPDPAGDAALLAALAQLPEDPRKHVRGSTEETKAQKYAARRERLRALIQDPTDAHLAVQSLMQDARALPAAARLAMEQRAVAASARTIPEEELMAAWMLEHYGLVREARTRYESASRRYLTSGANAELGDSSWVAGMSRTFARRALSESPQRAQELVEIGLAFATHHDSDLELEREIGEKLAGPPARPGAKPKLDYDHPELRGPSTDAGFVLDFWDVVAKRLALLAAIAALYLAFSLARRSASTRRADLHAVGMRTTSERAAGFFTRPFDRLRHVSLAYATRFERLVMAGVGATFIIALGASAAARRMDTQLRVFLLHPASSIPGGADVLRLLEARHAAGGSPAVLRLLADAYRARHDYPAARAALEELENRLPGYHRTALDRGVVEEEAGGDPEPFYAAAAAGDGEPAAAARWNQARRRGDAAARAAAEAGLPPPARRTARALAGTKPLWLPARHSDLQATAFDASAIRHQMVAGVLRLLFQPGFVYESVQEDVGFGDEGYEAWLKRGVAFGIAGLAMSVTYVALLASMLALVWLPLPVRRLYEPPARAAATPYAPSFKRRAIVWVHDLGRGMLADFVYFVVGLADLFVPGIQDLADGRAAAGVLKLMMLIGGSAVGAIADETLKYNGSAIVAAFAGREPPLLALIGELAWSLVWLVYLTNLPAALARMHRAGVTRISLISAELGLMPAHLARFLVCAIRCRRPLHEAVRAYAADHAMVLRDRRDAEALARELEAGVELPDALSRFPLFPSWVAKAAAWGRAADRMPQALEAASDLLSRERRLNQKIRRVMLLPTLQAALIAWFGAITLRLFAPQIADIARAMPGGGAGGPAAVPLALIAMCAEYAGSLQLAAVFLFVVFASAMTTLGGPVRRVLDALAGWVLPSRRRALADLRHAAAARLLGFALETRAPVHEALAAVAVAFPGAPLAPRFRDAAVRAEHGESPARTLASNGERDGDVLFELAGAFEHDGAMRLQALSERLHASADVEIERLPAVLVPVMTLFTGFFVLIFMGSIIGVLSSIAESSARALLG